MIIIGAFDLVREIREAFPVRVMLDKDMKDKKELTKKKKKELTWQKGKGNMFQAKKIACAKAMWLEGE